MSTVSLQQEVERKARTVRKSVRAIPSPLALLNTYKLIAELPRLSKEADEIKKELDTRISVIIHLKPGSDYLAKLDDALRSFEESFSRATDAHLHLLQVSAQINDRGRFQEFRTRTETMIAQGKSVIAYVRNVLDTHKFEYLSPQAYESDLHHSGGRYPRAGAICVLGLILGGILALANPLPGFIVLGGSVFATLLWLTLSYNLLPAYFTDGVSDTIDFFTQPRILGMVALTSGFLAVWLGSIGQTSGATFAIALAGLLGMLGLASRWLEAP